MSQNETPEPKTYSCVEAIARYFHDARRVSDEEIALLSVDEQRELAMQCVRELGGALEE